MPPRRQTVSSASPAPGQQSSQGQTSQQQQGTNGYTNTTSLALPGSSQGWNRAIPIDPALQTPAAQYPNYYQQYQQYYAQAQAHAQAQQAHSQQNIATRSTAQASGSGGGGGNEDITNMQDVLGAAGVDLRAEEEGLQRSHTTYRLPTQSSERARRTAQSNPHIGTAIRTIASHHSISKVPDESIQYLTFALQTRLEELLNAAIGAAQHRKKTQVLDPPPLYEDGSPMWSKTIRRDIGKQLAVIERIEREEETRIRSDRKSREDAAQAAKEAANPNGTPQHLTDEDHPKKKRKKDLGPGVIAKTMSEETRKKMSNAAASHAAGLANTKKYAWMHAGNAPSSHGSSAPRTEPQVISPGKGGTKTNETGVVDASGKLPSSTTAGASAAGAKTGSGGWARGRVVAGTEKKDKEEEDTRLQVTLRDLIFVVERERGHGAGRGSARGWT